MKYNFDELIDRRGTNSSKWDGPPLFEAKLGEKTYWNDETIPMFHSDLDFACAPAIIEALHRVADRRIFGYTSHLWEPEYERAIVSWYKRRYDTHIEPGWIQFVKGTLEALKLAICAFSSVGDGVIITRPVYGAFNGVITSTGRQIVNCPLVRSPDGSYSMEWEAFERVCAEPVNKVFLLCSPANPTGTIWGAEELSRMAEICRNHSVLLISDEVHCDLLRAGRSFTTIIKAAADISNIIMVTSISKTFNLAGLAVANVIIPDKRLLGIYKKRAGFGKPSPFDIAALIAAYNDSEEWLDAVNIYLDECIDFSVDYIRRFIPGVFLRRPDATYFLWLDFAGCGLPPGEIHDRIYRRANVMLQDGEVHDPENGKYFQRLAVTSPKSVIRTALERIAAEF